MKTKMTWFIIGFVVSCLMLGSVISYIFLLPRDYSQLCSKSDEPRVLDWLKSAKGRKLGAFHVFTPSASSNASAIIHPPKPNCFPQILIQDINKDGKLDNILITGSAYHTISVNDNNGDGVIDSYSYTPEGNTQSISYTDYNMDGQYDMRFNAPAASVFIESQWHDLIIKDTGKYIDINGTVKQVESAGGVWRIIEE